MKYSQRPLILNYFRTSKRWHLLAIWLAIAAVACRGLIPAGFMPATGVAARDGAVLVICPHGEFSSHAGDHGHGGQTSTSSFEQCPFGAAAGPALPATKLAYSFERSTSALRPEQSAPQPESTQSLRLPPARGPPLLS